MFSMPLSPQEMSALKPLSSEPMPPVYDSPATARLTELLEENLKLARDTNRTLHAMRRVALFAFFGKIILWLIVLGVPIFFLSSYLTPLLERFSSTGTTDVSTRVFGLPSGADIQRAYDEWQATHPSK